MEGLIDRWMDGQIDRWTDRSMGWMDRPSDKCKTHCRGDIHRSPGKKMFVVLQLWIDSRQNTGECSHVYKQNRIQI